MRQPQKPRGTKSQDDGLAEAGDPSGSFCPPPPWAPHSTAASPTSGPFLELPEEQSALHATLPLLRPLTVLSAPQIRSHNPEVISKQD